MDNKYLILGLIGIIAGITAIRAYEVSGLAAAIVSLLIAGWILINIRTAEGVLDGLGTLLEPFHTGINFLLLGFLYASLEGRGFWISLGSGVAAALLGSLVSMWVYKYWTIGE
jgi:hypothetical protein